MSEFTDSMGDALEGMEAYCGEPFTFRGVTYRGIKNEIEFETDFLAGGQFFKLGMQLVISRRNLSTKPNVGETLLIEGETFRIEKVKQDEVSFDIQCVSASA